MRRPLANLLLALACTVTAFLGFSETASNPVAKSKTPEQVPSQPGCGPTCGTERWAVKTLSDPDCVHGEFYPSVANGRGLGCAASTYDQL